MQSLLGFSLKSGSNSLTWVSEVNQKVFSIRTSPLSTNTVPKEAFLDTYINAIRANYFKLYKHEDKVLSDSMFLVFHLLCMWMCMPCMYEIKGQTTNCLDFFFVEMS